MGTHLLRTLVIVLCLCWLAGCNRQSTGDSAASDMSAGKAADNYTASERAAAAKLKQVRDPIEEEIYKFRVNTRQAYNNRRFDQLERIAGEVRTAKALFGNGSWKIAQFYESFECREEEPESMWELHDQIHRAWTAVKPASITARLAYADFLVGYGWHARGHEYANKVTPKGWKLFAERLAAARTAFGEAQSLPEKDPYLWVVGLSIALAQDWPESGYSALLGEAHAAEPRYWGYDTTRAISLLPRWYGQPGEWETYAEETSARPDGLGAELYARIVATQATYYKNVFRETQASWPRTREGLEQMRQRYPDSLVILNTTAMLATMAEDRALAKEIFDRLDDTCLTTVWGTPERFIQFRNRAETGQGEIH
jgi:hypothetical protein